MEKEIMSMMRRILDIVESVDDRLKTIEDKVDEKAYWSFSEGETKGIAELRFDLDKISKQLG